jgi:hypothetical protein
MESTMPEEFSIWEVLGPMMATTLGFLIGWDIAAGGILHRHIFIMIGW